MQRFYCSSGWQQRSRDRGRVTLQGRPFPSLPLVHVDHGPNSAKAQQQHYVVLVSLDGFRWDYAKRENATHLLALGKQGAWAPKACCPAIPRSPFPTTTPSSPAFTPSTRGSSPTSSSTQFATPAMPPRPQAVTDGSWYSGTPLWSLAESQGMRTASIFWVGSEAEIAGFRPSWYAQFTQDRSHPGS